MKRQRQHYGVYVLIERGDHLLLVVKTRGPYTGMMDLPGGTPDFGERPIETAVREAREELGLEIRPDELTLESAIGFLHEDADAVLFHQGAIFCYRGGVDRIHEQAVESADTKGCAWTPRDASTLSPLVRAALHARSAVVD